MIEKFRRRMRHQGKRAARCSLFIQVMGWLPPLRYKADQ